MNLRILLLGLVMALLALPAAAHDRDFDRLEQRLRLNPIQQEQFEIAVRATKRALLTIGLGALQMKTAFARELLKDRPDPRALELAQDELVEMSRPLIRNARDEWLRLYAMMDDDQVAIARAMIEERMKKVERLAEHLSEYLARELRQH